MFAAIVSGRLVQTFDQVGETQFLTTIHSVENINHIVVFLTGVIPFPEGMGALVYFSWPDANAPPSWQILGHLTGEKPSAIFKINNLKKTASSTNTLEQTNAFGEQMSSHHAQIGISVEPMLQVQQQSAITTSQNINSSKQFCEKMLESFFNYMSSFTINQAQMTPNPSETFVPLSVLQSWYTNFERKLQLNPNFWRN
ncbi:Protein OPI10 [Blattella germanica]|nr:Protein OPI10 [Blattella germanica]